jgi:hypothetical protein
MAVHETTVKQIRAQRKLAEYLRNYGAGSLRSRHDWISGTARNLQPAARGAESEVHHGSPAAKVR